MKKFAVIVAGGSGSRMGNAVPKQFLELNGKPLLWYTLQAFLNAYADLRIILVLPSEHLNVIGVSDRVRVTVGGKTRFHSVKNGLALVDDDSIVCVHDAVRCLVSTQLIQRCYVHAMEHGNAIPAVHSADSIRIDNGSGPEVADRNKVYAIQTPQTFKADILKKAFEAEYKESFTDEATVAEAAGVKIHLVEGERTNIKITYPFDLLIAEAVVRNRRG